MFVIDVWLQLVTKILGSLVEVLHPVDTDLDKVHS